MIKMEKYPYENVIDSLMFAMICTIPNLAYFMSLLSRYISSLGYGHWLPAKHVISYIANTFNIRLVFKNLSDD